MNLVEKMLRIDKAKPAERETKEIVSRRLSKIMGEETKITIQELGGKKINNLNSALVDKNGNRDMSRLYDVNLMYCVEGVVEPSMKDERLLEHFGAASPKDLAALLFGVEAGKIADEIVGLAGLGEKTEEKVKN